MEVIIRIIATVIAVILVERKGGNTMLWGIATFLFPIVVIGLPFLPYNDKKLKLNKLHE